MNLLRTVTRPNDESDEIAGAPNALDLLHNDHEEVAALFKTALDDGTPAAAKRAAIAKVLFALTVHAKMEEKIFYPALRKAGKKDEKDSVLEAAEEHGMVKDMIAKIQRLQSRDETLQAKLIVLKDMVEHHVREEESQIFEEARKVLSGKLDALGAEMQTFKDRAGARNGKTAPGRKKAVRSTSRTSTSRAPATRKGPARRTSR
jgi:hemerythrin superfamily protein